MSYSSKHTLFSDVQALKLFANECNGSASNRNQPVGPNDGQLENDDGLSADVIRLWLATAVHKVRALHGAKQGFGDPQRRSHANRGGMTLYLKAAADGTLVGDCPFAHFVRLVLEEKGLQYELKPCTEDTKPAWLTEYYEGKLPALRHRKECYVESDVIADYLDFFFPDPSLKGGKKEMDEAEDAISGFFPSVAKYLKHIPDGDDEDQEMKCSLESVLLRLEEHLQLENRTGPYLVGNGEKLTLLDCSLSPKLYHLRTGIEAFKDNAIDLAQKFPAVNEYLDSMLKRESFQKTVYDKDVIIWGWSNARK